MHLALGGISVKWGKIFHMKAFYIPPDRDGHFLTILTYRVFPKKLDTV
jgi:hypothetical protein